MAEYLTAEEVAERLKMHPRTIRRLLQSGQLPGRKVGGKEWRVSAEALDQYFISPVAGAPTIETQPAAKKAPGKRAK